MCMQASQAVGTSIPTITYLNLLQGLEAWIRLLFWKINFKKMAEPRRTSQTKVAQSWEEKKNRYRNGTWENYKKTIKCKNDVIKKKKTVRRKKIQEEKEIIVVIKTKMNHNFTICSLTSPDFFYGSMESFESEDTIKGAESIIDWNRLYGSLRENWAEQENVAHMPPWPPRCFPQTYLTLINPASR